METQQQSPQEPAACQALPSELEGPIRSGYDESPGADTVHTAVHIKEEAMQEVPGAVGCEPVGQGGVDVQLECAEEVDMEETAEALEALHGLSMAQPRSELPPASAQQQGLQLVAPTQQLTGQALVTAELERGHVEMPPLDVLAHANNSRTGAGSRPPGAAQYAQYRSKRVQLSPTRLLHIPRNIMEDHLDLTTILEQGINIEVEQNGQFEGPSIVASVAVYKNSTGHSYYRILGFKSVCAQYQGWMLDNWRVVNATTVRMCISWPDDRTLPGNPLADWQIQSLQASGVMTGGKRASSGTLDPVSLVSNRAGKPVVKRSRLPSKSGAPASDSLLEGWANTMNYAQNNLGGANLGPLSLPLGLDGGGHLGSLPSTDTMMASLSSPNAGSGVTQVVDQEGKVWTVQANGTLTQQLTEASSATTQPRNVPLSELLLLASGGAPALQNNPSAAATGTDDVGTPNSGVPHLQLRNQMHLDVSHQQGGSAPNSNSSPSSNTAAVNLGMLGQAYSSPVSTAPSSGVQLVVPATELNLSLPTQQYAPPAGHPQQQGFLMPAYVQMQQPGASAGLWATGVSSNVSQALQQAAGAPAQQQQQIGQTIQAVLTTANGSEAVTLMHTPQGLMVVPAQQQSVQLVQPQPQQQQPSLGFATIQQQLKQLQVSAQTPVHSQSQQQLQLQVQLSGGMAAMDATTAPPVQTQQRPVMVLNRSAQGSITGLFTTAPNSGSSQLSRLSGMMGTGNGPASASDSQVTGLPGLAPASAPPAISMQFISHTQQHQQQQHQAMLGIGPDGQPVIYTIVTSTPQQQQQQPQQPQSQPQLLAALQTAAAGGAP